MLVLVTGGHGFVGSHLVRRLLAQGDRVRCLVRRPGVPASLQGLTVEVVTGDVTRPETLLRALEGVEEVYHLAARLTALSRSEMFRTNARGTRHLVEAALAQPGLRRFVHCSSLAVAGPSSGAVPHAEGTPHAPVTWYGSSKALAERIVTAFGARGLPFTIVRPPVVYGPWDRGLLPVFRAVGWGLRPLLGAQPKVYSWIYGPDLAEALVVLGRHPRTVGRTYFAAHAEVASLASFLDLAGAAFGRRLRTLRASEGLLRLAASVADLVAQATGSPGMLTRDKLHEILPRAWVCSPRAAALEAGWQARTPLAEGIPATVAWYRRNRWA